MSSFLTDKYLKYRGSIGQKLAVIEVDRFCEGCGYNLRGLVSGRACPECGIVSLRAEGGSDPLLAGDYADRQRILLGFTLLPFCLIVAAAARVWVTASLLFAVSTPYLAYLILGFALSGVWVAGVWLTTPTRLNAQGTLVRRLRIAARWTQPLWLVGYAVWIIHFLATSGAGVTSGFEDAAKAISLCLRAAAAIGTLPFFLLLLNLAESAGLDSAARKINLALWMLPLPTLLLALVPGQVFILVLLFMIAPLLAVWVWFMWVMARGIIILRQHVSWALRIAAEHHDHMRRMAETKRELDDEVKRRIRPIAPPQTDDPVPLDG